MLERVSLHAVLRYLERVLSLPVDAWLAEMPAGTSEARRVLSCCERAGLPVDAVRSSVLCRPVMLAVTAGFKDTVVRFGGFCYVIRDGAVVTILTERMRDQRIGQLGKVKVLDRTSMRREILKNNRRNRGKIKSRDRRLAEVD
ncbi:hypothetical protein [Rhizobium leguminosarum]|uniref:hypothetical protein n=1 Tax=Rhizobium leguminosarum TaxID=384 RepID=UPI0010400C48|nr:hypothetical protein [Rhizobium leguminosarum]TBY40859.1 hypothetical protein E0H54_31720 [Rhizobium leguminosarum bv. viciae]